MAIFVPGATVGAISGNLGGVVFEAGGNGNVIKTRGMATNKLSQKQLAQRAKYQDTLNRWYAISEETRATWNRTARSFSITNRLGITRPISGWQLFFKAVQTPYQAADPDNYPQSFVGFAESPQITASYSVYDSSWYLDIEEPIDGEVDEMYVWYSRPRKTIGYKNYYRWTRVYPFEVSPGSWRWRYISDVPAGLEDAQIGEVIGVKVSQAIASSRGILLPSAPSTINVTVTAS